jgi:hypothetical protein
VWPLRQRFQAVDGIALRRMADTWSNARPAQKRMASLEQVRAIFDAQEIGLILIGMPGIERRLARYPQSIPASASSMSSGRWEHERSAQRWRANLSRRGSFG